MEILSTGKKIKRARIYKGLTLKALCGDKISVSKLSCIENDKIEAEDKVLKYIAKELQLDYSYLVQDIKSQIKKNIEQIVETLKGSNFIEQLNYNFEIANEYEYYDLAFEVLHLIFNYYIAKKDFKNCHKYLKKYYNISARFSSRGEILFSDIGDFIYLNKEYDQALNFYNATLDLIKTRESKENTVLMYEVIIKKCFCLIYMDEISEARKELDVINYGIEFIENKVIKAKNYGILAYFNSENESIAKAYIDMGIEIIQEDRNKLIEILKEYTNLFRVPHLKYLSLYCCEKMLGIKEVVKVTDSIESMLSVINIFYSHKIYDRVLQFCDECLNNLKDVDNNKVREQLYYYKAKALDAQGQYISAELFYNLSLELIVKTSDIKKLHKRYMEFGNLYYKMNNASEAIKYMNLAMEL